jgi:hypothetical protein
MKVKFLADVNLSAAIVEAALRLEASIDFKLTELLHLTVNLIRRSFRSQPNQADYW